MSSGNGRNGDVDPEKTRLTSQLSGSDSDKTHALNDLGAVAELRAKMTSPGPNDKLSLPLYAMADTIVIGRGTACDWQLDDASLSRKHAQFRWNGMTGGLTVEDLGSANGTRVNGRPCRGETPVEAGEQVQLGTVVVVLELKRKTTADEQKTRLVQSPGPAHDESEPSLTPLPPGRTVVRPQPERGAPNQHAQVFRPEKDAARPDDPTRSWDARAALVRAPEKTFDPEWLDQIKNMWRTNRRPLVLAGAAAWIALLLIVWASVENKETNDEDPFANMPSVQQKAPATKPKVTPPKPNVNANANVNVNVNVNANANANVNANVNANAYVPPPDVDPERADALEKAIAAYDQGRMPEALSLFKRLSADGKDPAAKFMVDLIEQRQGATP